MNCIGIAYVRSVCGNGQLVTVMAFVLGLPAGKDYSASRSVTTPVVSCVPEHHRQPDRIRPIRIWRVTSRTRRRPGAKKPKVAVATYTAVLVAVADNLPLLGPVVAVQIWWIDGTTDPGSQ
jgi:hypothetical protein